jgi:uncharacterized membrane protein YphA (DoxX/SURF4 family)
MNFTAAHAPVSGQVRAADVFAVLARWLLGAMFLYMGLSKALHPVEFLKLVRQYDVLHHHLVLNLVASTLPWFEIFCGLLLLLGVAVRSAAVMLVAMLVPFTVAVLLRALAIQEAGGLPFCAIKFDCGCGAGEVLICRKLAENVLLTTLSMALLFWRSHRLCLRHSIFKADSTSEHD